MGSTLVFLVFDRVFLDGESGDELECEERPLVLVGVDGDEPVIRNDMSDIKHL